MNWNKVKHIVLITAGLLCAFAGVVYQGTLANTQVSPGMTFGILAGLVLVMWSRISVILGSADDGDVATVTRIFHGAAALAGMAIPVLVLVQSKYAAGSQAAIVVGYLSTFMGDLAKTGGVPPIVDVAKKVVAILLTAGLLAASPLSAAEPTPSLAAPPLSFCLGSTFHCVMPDFNLMAVNYDFAAKKWDGQVQSIGAGYVLLFYSDQTWTSGIAVHGAGQWKQGGPSYFSIIPTLVIFRYFEAGATLQLADGAFNKWLTLGIGGQLDILSGKSMAVRHAEALSTYGAQHAAQ